MGQAFLFVPLLAMTWIFGLFLAMVASHYFLSVLESSGQGNDHIEMPDEPFVDWVGKVVYLAFFVILWGIPSLIVMASTKGMDEIPRFMMIALPFWLLFPVGILSPLCLQSRWMPFWPGLISRMLAEKPAATFQFYLLSLPVTFLMYYAFWKLTQSETSYPTVFLFALVTAVCFLLYARLLGRYGFVLTFTKGLFSEKVKKKKRPRPRPQVVEEEPVFVQPTEMKGLRDPFDEEVTGYGVNLGKVEEVKPPLPTIDDEESYIVEEGLEVEEPVVGSQALQNTSTSAFDPPPEEEVQMYVKNRQIKEPTTPFGSETIAFLANPDMMTGLLKLCGGFAIFSLLIHFMASVRPV